MNILRNQRHLVKGEDCLYAICPSYPVIEKYDLHEILLKKVESG